MKIREENEASVGVVHAYISFELPWHTQMNATSIFLLFTIHSTLL